MPENEAVNKVVEESLDAMEKTMDLVEKGTCNLTPKQHLIQAMVIGAVAGGSCAVAGYLIAKRQMKTKYEEILAQEIANAKAFYSTLHKKEQFNTPEQAIEALHPPEEPRKMMEATEAITQYQGKTVQEEVVVKNVFTENKAEIEFDYEEEVKHRTPDRPYIISEDEFLQNENDFIQTTLSYYEGDGTLADEQDQEIPYPDPIIGEGNLERFGYGSGDPRTVFVRNERLSHEYEVVKHDGKFSEEVLGFTHADEPSLQRMRSQRRKSRGGDE